MPLNDAEKKQIAQAADKASRFVSGHALDAKVHDQILKTVETLQKKSAPVVGKEAIALWSAKIDYAIANGDRQTVSKLISVSPVGAAGRLKTEEAWYDSNDNCGCGGGTGPTSW